MTGTHQMVFLSACVPRGAIATSGVPPTSVFGRSDREPASQPAEGGGGREARRVGSCARDSAFMLPEHPTERGIVNHVPHHNWMSKSDTSRATWSLSTEERPERSSCGFAY